VFKLATKGLAGEQDVLGVCATCGDAMIHTIFWKKT